MNARGITPILNVSSLEQSFAWFIKLGWQKAWEWGEPASFGGVTSGEQQIFLCLNAQGGRGKGNNTATFGVADGETADKGVWLSVWVDDVDAVYQHCLEQEVEVLHAPENMPWNVRECHVRHPDGHVFRISCALEGC